MRCASVVALVFLAACAPKPNGVTTGPPSDLAGTNPTLDLAGADLALVAGSNSVPIVVDSGPAGTAHNIASISITLCAPGSTTSCATIDHVSIDTGSVGLRVLATSLPSGLASAFPAGTDASGNMLGDCTVFADGYTWGSVRHADVTIGGEQAASLPFQLIADPALATVPSPCSGTGNNEGDLQDFGSNGLIGVGLYPTDCGGCDSAKKFSNGFPYYSCTSSGVCTQAAPPAAEIIPHPVTRMADNNGIEISLPTIDDAGAESPTGTLTFGIGTRSNNALGSATIFPITQSNPEGVKVSYNGHTYPTGIFDTGTTDYLFDDPTIAQCSQGSQFFCPPSTMMLSASNIDTQAQSHAVAFTLGNAEQIFSAKANAYDDIGVDNTQGFDAFIWGLPFFFGKHVFVGIDGAAYPGGTGPFVAY